MILIDTGPLVGLCHPLDPYNKAAAKHLKAFATCDFAVCEPILAEACFHLRHREHRQRVRELLDELDVLVLPAVPDRSYWDDVLGWLAKYADQEPDWADACVAVLCGRNHDLEVWTYDSEFRTTWRRPDGTRIPLAV